MSILSKAFTNPRSFFRNALRNKSRTEDIQSTRVAGQGSALYRRMTTGQVSPRASLDLITKSRVLLKLPLLNGCDKVTVSWAPSKPSLSAIAIGWGLKGTGLWAKEMKQKYGCKAFFLEDGFLRSAEREDPAISIVVDDLGIYYDATCPSRLEQMIGRELSPEKADRASNLQQAWISGSVSKYNSNPEFEQDLPSEFVLVIDQVAGDQSVSGGLAGPETFEKMLRAALDENPGVAVVVKTHPDKDTRSAPGYFSRATEGLDPRIIVIDAACHPVRLLRSAKAVYVGTSQIGFEALLHGAPVRCFGMPFYAGWGLTSDDLPRPSRRKSVEIESLVHASLIDYPIYGDPVTGRDMEAEEAIDQMASARRAILKDSNDTEVDRVS